MTKKRAINGIEIEQSSGNIFADLALPHPERTKIKSGLILEIISAVKRLGLTQQQASNRMKLPQPKVSALLRGNPSNISERKLLDCLNQLGYDIEIRIRPSQASTGSLALAMG